MREMSVQDVSKVSSKPWYLTFFGEEMYIWKNSCRMKLVDGSSSGPVATTSFISGDIVNVS